MNHDRVILEILGRVATLEDEVAKLKENMTDGDNPNLFSSSFFSSPASSKKDTTRYLFKGNAYGKGRLVLAVVKEYVRENPEVSASELTLTFDKTLQGGSFGVVRELEEAKAVYRDYQRRFFAAPDEVIHTASGDCVVCSQWGKSNINDFIKRASQLEFEIEAVGGR